MHRYIAPIILLHNAFEKVKCRMHTCMEQFNGGTHQVNRVQQTPHIYGVEGHILYPL